MQNIVAKNIVAQNITASAAHQDLRPRVSVIIVSYNMGQYIEQAIRSVLQQSFTDLELIIVDDGSTDNTQRVVAPFFTDNRLRYIHQENAGQTHAKNRGIELSRGEFIGFCDADDYWHKDKLVWQLPYFDNPDVGVVYTEINLVDESNHPINNPGHEIRHQGRVTEQLLIENFVPFGTALIRRECINQLGAFDPKYKMGIDWHLWLRYSLHWAFAYCPERSYTYRLWSGQMSNNIEGRYANARNILQHFLQEQGKHLPAVWARKAWADMDIKEANIVWKKTGARIKPLRYFIHGIVKNPASFYAWKTFLKFLIGKR